MCFLSSPKIARCPLRWIFPLRWLFPDFFHSVFADGYISRAIFLLIQTTPLTFPHDSHDFPPENTELHRYWGKKHYFWTECLIKTFQKIEMQSRIDITQMALMKCLLFQRKICKAVSLTTTITTQTSAATAAKLLRRNCSNNKVDEKAKKQAFHWNNGTARNNLFESIFYTANKEPQLYCKGTFPLYQGTVVGRKETKKTWG